MVLPWGAAVARPGRGDKTLDQSVERRADPFNHGWLPELAYRAAQES